MFNNWKYKPTFKLILAREAQLYHTLLQFINMEYTTIEYSTKSLGVFAEISHAYNEKQTSWCIDNGVKLWFGDRDPAAPQFTSSCTKCEFKKQCRWYLMYGKR
ncbi:unnamed protein product [Ambrosiozyma monospora]|uniref:Unnamed protein product n=1 Tax=Ambrosiozyma monospora TaxID=43982 RepID=A0ACB5TAQ5_AMBMO|nr:unnamed protein product [Ambrosiozyma monospora]